MAWFSETPMHWKWIILLFNIHTSSISDQGNICPNNIQRQVISHPNSVTLSLKEKEFLKNLLLNMYINSSLPGFLCTCFHISISDYQSPVLAEEPLLHQLCESPGRDICPYEPCFGDIHHAPISTFACLFLRFNFKAM